MIQVFDNFCPSIDAVRDSFRASGFGTWAPPTAKVGSGKYEGMNYVGEHRYLIHALWQTLGRVIIPNSMFARVTNLGTEKAYIHSDRVAGSHTCIVYLSGHPKEVSGTAFYRHKETGLLEMPVEWMDDKERGKEMVEGSSEVFEQTDFVRGLYNRALVFSAPLFHSRFPIHGIGKTPEDGRLIWACHFDAF